MATDSAPLKGPDFALGVLRNSIPDGGMLLGHAFGEAVLLSRTGNEVHAIGATCSHYGGPLAEGVVVGDTVRCPWHHACFSLRTGEALRAPALSPVACWDTELRGDRVVVTKKVEGDPLARSALAPQASAPTPDSRRFVIVGAGAAGTAAAEMLRRSGFTGSLTLVDGEPDSPYDRPNLSKDYLAGTAPRSRCGFVVTYRQYVQHAEESGRARGIRVRHASHRLSVGDRPCRHPAHRTPAAGATA